MIAFIAVPIAVLADILRARLARAAVGELVIALRSDPAPGDLRDALARALRRPLARRSPPGCRSSRPTPTSTASRWRCPADPRRVDALVERDGTPVAALVHDPSLRDEPELLDAVARGGRDRPRERAPAGRAAGPRGRAARLARTRILEAARASGERLERDLHDGAQQRLVALHLELGMLERATARRPRDARAVARGPRRARRVARGAARARPRHPPGGPDRPRPAGRARAARRARARARPRRRRRSTGACPSPSRWPPTSSCPRPDQRREVRAAPPRPASRSPGQRRRRACEIVDDGIGGADSERRLRAARARRPRRGARRAPARWTARAARARGCGRRSRARSDRRGRRRCSARASRACSATPGSRSSRSAATPRSCCERSRAARPTSRSSTSACRRRTPTRACAPRSRSARATRRSACSCCRSTSSSGSRWSCSSDSVEGVGYLLKDRVGTCGVRRGGAPGGGRRLGGRPGDRLARCCRRRRRDDPLEPVTPREREVLALMAEGRSNQGIADRLEVSERAVQKHITAIFRKLGLARGARRPSARARGAGVPARGH